MIEKGSKWWNDGNKHKRSVVSPGPSWVPGRLYKPRAPMKPEAHKKRSESLMGNVPWNAGLTGVYSVETLEKMSKAKEGYVPWNAGLKTVAQRGIGSPMLTSPALDATGQEYPI